MNSMNLIYRDATKALGLLTTPIRTKRGLALVELLLSDQLCWKRAESVYVFRKDVNYRDIINIIQILHDPTTDIWWTRAWVFQEEYISGLRMDLLIPLAAGVDSFPSPRPIPGQLCVNASDFRKYATIFLLAYKNTRWKRYQGSCDRMLNIVGKYKILFPNANESLVCMSARIFADIGDRSIKVPWDVLAITANACGYDRRLDKDSLLKNKKSLSLCLLTLYLINGEIIRDILGSNGESKDLLDIDIATFLKNRSLQNDSPYNVRQELSFFKNCRLSWVKFCRRGLQTTGLLWRLQPEDRIHTGALFNNLELQEQEISCSAVWDRSLSALAVELRRKHPSLASKLLKYIDDRRGGTDSLALGYMDRMVETLVTAIGLGHVLRVGYLEGDGAGAIFIPHRNDILEPLHALTAWQPGSSDINNLDNFVSLKVNVRSNGSLDVVDWMGGLAFFHGIEARAVVLAWPRSWEKRLQPRDSCENHIVRKQHPHYILMSKDVLQCLGDIITSSTASQCRKSL